MNETFESTLSGLKGQESAFRRRDEHAVEIGVVLPLLRRAGWNTENISEIYPQRGLSDGSKVDFDLQIDGESRIMIEVKKWGHDLDEEDEEQLADYCRDPHHRPKLAVLTNGRKWRIYLPPNKGKNTPLKWVREIDITSSQFVEVQSTFNQFLSRDSMVDFGPAENAARKLHKASQAYENFRKNFTKAWNELVGDNNKLTDLVLEFSESKGIPASEDNAMHFLESLDEQLVNEVATTRKSGKKPASFALPTKPAGKTKKKFQLRKKPKGWKNFLLELCELMHERHAESFRPNILSATGWFAEIEDSKFSIPIGETGIYTRWGKADEFKDTCYDVVTKFNYPRDSLVIWDSKGATL